MTKKYLACTQHAIFLLVIRLTKKAPEQFAIKSKLEVNIEAGHPTFKTLEGMGGDPGRDGRTCDLPSAVNTEMSLLFSEP